VSSGATIRVISSNGKFLKLSRLLHAAADQPIDDGTETAAAGPGARRLYDLGDAIVPTIVPGVDHIAVVVNAIEMPPAPSPSFGA
jgi:hypothetical protein